MSKQPDSRSRPHQAEGLINPKVLAKKAVTDFGYPRACRIRKYQIDRLGQLPTPIFFKMWLKLAKMKFFDFF
jgi:hypothetical protein